MTDMTDPFAQLSPEERAVLDGILALSPEPGARLGALIDLHGHLTPAQLRNVRRALDALPDASTPIRQPRPEI